MASDDSLDCPGEGRCHGCMSWCDRCGDVDTVCDAAPCDQHRCYRCQKILSREERELAYDDRGGFPSPCFVCFVKEAHDEAREGAEIDAMERATRVIEKYVGMFTRAA
jgi:hypothetical protein